MAATTLSKETERKAWEVGCIAVIGGALNGFDLGALGAASVLIDDDWELPGWQLGLILGAFAFGQTFGALSGGLASDWSAARSPLNAISRRSLIVFAYLLFFVASVICYFSVDWVMLCISRIILGFSSGISFSVIPIYVGEVAPASIRGAITSVLEITINFGVLLAMAICFVVTWTTNEDSTTSYLTWRLLISISGSPCLLLAYCTVVYCPLSPRFLLNTGRVEAARKVLTDDLRYDANTADFLIEEMKDAKRVEDSMQMNTLAFWKSLLFSIFCCKRQESENDDIGTDERRELLPTCDKRVVLGTRTLTLGLTLATVQQLGGVDNLLMFMSTILSDHCDLSKTEALFWVMVAAMVKVLVILLVIWKADILGRKRLMVWSSIVMTLSMTALLAVLLLATVSTSNSHTTGFGALRQHKWLVYAWTLFVICFMGGFSLGWGPLLWAFLSEIFPVSMKSTAVPICMCGNRMAASIQMFLFPPVRNYLSIFAVYSFFLLVLLYGLWYVIKYVPETAQHSIESIFIALCQESKTKASIHEPLLVERKPSTYEPMVAVKEDDATV